MEGTNGGLGRLRLGAVYIHRVQRTAATKLIIAMKFVGLFVARRDASERFESAEEVLNEMPPSIFVGVVLGVSSGPLA